MIVLLAIPAFAVGVCLLIQAFADPEPFINAGRFVYAKARRKPEPIKRV